ncbi:ABC transporter permease [Blautia marasmi]|uniref:ABC transporter permease n=1 Tax=Blautia marasmi TaxID=1917868 RepID=UPI003511B0E0
MKAFSKSKKNEMAKQEPFFKNMKRRYQLWLMLIPAILSIVIFNYGPMYGIQLAFREFDFTKGLTGGEFVGLTYFIKFFKSFQFTDILRNTFVISFTTLILGFPIPIILALLMNQIKKKRTKKILQTTFYAPHFISMVVMVGLLNVLLAPNTGIISSLFGMLGADINLLGDKMAFVPVYVLSDIWQHAGWNSIIFLAALSSVDSQLYDACKVDGANKWQVIRHVDIPCLVPTMIIMLILNMGNILNVGFEKVFLMQNSSNISVAEVISTYVYKIGIRSNQYSYSAAIGLFNTLINFIMLVVVNRISKKVSDTSLF